MQKHIVFAISVINYILKKRSKTRRTPGCANRSGRDKVVFFFLGGGFLSMPYSFLRDLFNIVYCLCL